MPTRIIRDGQLDEGSLVAALATERREGRRPTLLAVGGAGLETVALRILEPSPGSLGDLLAFVPNVVRDDTLAGHEWELREA